MSYVWENLKMRNLNLRKIKPKFIWALDGTSKNEPRMQENVECSGFYCN